MLRNGQKVVCVYVESADSADEGRLKAKRAAQFQVVFNRMLLWIEARRLKSLDVLIAAVGNNPSRPSLARQVNKTWMALKHQRPVKVQLPQRAVDAPFVCA